MTGRRPREVSPPNPQHPGRITNSKQTLGGLNANVTSAIPLPASAVKRSTSATNLNASAYQHSRSHSGSRMSLAASGLMRPPAQPVFTRSSSSAGVHPGAGSGSGVDGGGNGGGGGGHARPSGSTMLLQSARKSYHMGGPGGGMGVGMTPARGAHHLPMQTPDALSAAAAAAARRSSSYSARASMMGPAAPRESFFAALPVASGVPQDPRRLRDASARAQMAGEVMEYLTRNNYEMETGTVLSNKTLTSPTQKEFATLFKWLYNRIDPAYRFQKNLDAEIPPLLKLLRYPFEKNITKSQIAAVGGNNWHTFLGLLHWIMQLATVMDAYQAGKYDYACVEAGLDVMSDRIVFDFLSDAYRAWLSVEDGVDADAAAERAVQLHVDRMAERFREVNKELLDDVEILEAEKKSLQEQIAELERGTELGQKLDYKLQLIKGDNIKYEEWIAKVEQKIKKSGEKITLLEEEIGKVEDDIGKAEKEKAEHQDALSSKGITVQDLDRMTSEMDRLEKSKAAVVGRVDEVRARLAEQELDASRKLDELERQVEKYNAQAYKIGLIPATAANAKGQVFELSLTMNPPPTDLAGSVQGHAEPELRLLRDATTGYQPHQLLSLDLKGAVRGAIASLRREISERRNRALEEDMKNHSLLDKVMEAMDDKQAEVEGLGHRIRAAEEEYEKTKETTQTQKMNVDAQIERMEKELAKLRQGLTDSVQLMEQREINTNLEYVWTQEMAVDANGWQARAADDPRREPQGGAAYRD
jgi:kinetochore protein NDC80